MMAHVRHWFFEGMTQMNWSGVPGSATKQCFSRGATYTESPRLKGVSAPSVLIVPVPSRMKTSCSHSWEWNGVFAPG